MKVWHYVERAIAHSMLDRACSRGWRYTYYYTSGKLLVPGIDSARVGAIILWRGLSPSSAMFARRSLSVAAGIKAHPPEIRKIIPDVHHEIPKRSMVSLLESVAWTRVSLVLQPVNFAADFWSQHAVTLDTQSLDSFGSYILPSQMRDATTSLRTNCGDWCFVSNGVAVYSK